MSVLYVDKTLLIKKIIDSRKNNILINAPSRFGKSLNASMLSLFFNKCVD